MNLIKTKYTKSKIYKYIYNIQMIYVSNNCMQSQNKFIFGKLNQLKQLYVYSKNITQIFNTTKVTFHCFGKTIIRNSILILQSKTFTVSEKTKTRNSILTKQNSYHNFWNIPHKSNSQTA